MAMNTKEKNKKEKKKNKQEEESIPENLQDAPEPVKNDIAPPRPISLQESKGDIPKPTRLPPRFKARLEHTAVNQEQPDQHPQVSKSDEKEPEIEKNASSVKTGILPPVKIRQRRETIPKASEKIEQKTVQPTRIELDEEKPVSIIQNNRTTRTVSELAQQLEATSLLKQFNCDEILRRPKEETWPWKTSRTIKIPSELESYWKIEGSLYSAIAMLHFYSVAYEKGDVAQEVYSKQLKAHLLEAIQLRFKLEKDKKFNWDKFVKENYLIELFSEGIEKLARVSGSSDIDAALDEETIKINYQEMKKLPTKAADYVGNAIELMDLIRLQSVATVERLIPLLEDMKKIIISANIFDVDYWAIREMDLWIDKLYRMPPGSIPSEEELERFEMYVVRWLNDFRRELKNI